MHNRPGSNRPPRRPKILHQRPHEDEAIDHGEDDVVSVEASTETVRQLQEYELALHGQVYEAYKVWNALYARGDFQKSLRIAFTLRNVMRNVDAAFVEAFFLLGDYQWERMTYEQFLIVLETLQTVSEKQQGEDPDPVVRLKANRKAGWTASDAMRLFIRYPLSDEKSRILSEALIGGESTQVAEQLCMILPHYDLDAQYFQEALYLLRLDRVTLAAKFLSTCERWNLDIKGAKRLCANMVFFLNQERGSDDGLGQDKCEELLKAPAQHIFMSKGRVLDS